MAFERNTTKKVYYYVICAVTLLILTWGLIDVTSAVLSITIFKAPSISLEAPSGPQSAAEGKGGVPEPSFDEYYQGRMLIDRIGDSIARVIVSGLIFAYAGYRIRELEAKEI
jgi:hypothetical protein